MRWIKVIALAIGIIVVFSVISAIVHALFWIAVGAGIAAIAIGAFRARNALRGGKRPAGHDSLTRATHDILSRAAGDAPSSRAPGGQRKPAQRGTAQTGRDAARLHQDVEEELARLKRELE